VSSNRTRDNVSLIVKLVLFAGLSAVLTTIVVTSVLDINTNATVNYKAVFSDATGIQPGDSVRIAGVEVGKVAGVSLLSSPPASNRCGPTTPPGGDATPTCALVTFSLNSNQHLTTSTGARIYFANLLGQRFMGLVPGSGGGSPLRPGGVIPVSQTTPGLDLTAVFNGFQPLFNALSPDEVNQLSTSIIQVFQGESGTVASLVSQTASITTNLANREQVLDQVLTNLAGLLQAVNGQGTQLGQLIDNFNALVSGLATQRTQLGNTITGVSQLTNSVAGVLQGSRPAFDNDISGLASAAGTLSVNQGKLDGLLQGLPGLVQSLSKIASTGSYINVYLCNLTVNVHGAINISLVPGLPAPQYPANLQLPSGEVGNQAFHTRNCGG
jgi:phospholipid/cholesterol/gamma-HCH transport system substrate-binding protein